MNNETQFFKEIKTIVCEIIGLEENEIKGDEKLGDEFGIESIMIVELANAIEEKYNIQIPEEKYKEFDSLNSIMAILDELLIKK